MIVGQILYLLWLIGTNQFHRPTHSQWNTQKFSLQEFLRQEESDAQSCGSVSEPEVLMEAEPDIDVFKHIEHIRKLALKSS